MPRDRDLSAWPWTRLAASLREAGGRSVALLPVGATEPHGPHLPLETDVIISVETSRRAAERLTANGLPAWVLPPIAYGVTEYARGFAGAVGLGGQTTSRLVEEVCRAALSQGFGVVCLVNSHLEPAHLDALREAAAKTSRETGRPVLFPDVTQRRWAATLTEEFRSGACHAGRYETSLVMAACPELVDASLLSGLAPVDISIGRKIREGARTFREAGGDQAYFGDPAAATRAEGEASYEALVRMVETSVREALG